MKSFLQVAVPLGILMVVIGVIAFVTQNTARPPKAPDLSAPDNPAESAPLVFQLDPAQLTNDKTLQVEFLSHHYKDFWFHNEHQEDVRVALDRKSCSCTDAEIGQFGLSHEEWKELKEAPTLSGVLRLVSTAKFTQLGNADAKEYQTIPGTPVGKEPLPYILRMNWHAKQSPRADGNPEKINVQILAQVGKGPFVQIHREVSYQVLLPVALWPFEVDLGEITPNGYRTQTFHVWSFTRDRIQFTPRLSGANGFKTVEPCAEFSTPVELTPQELKLLPTQLGPQFEKMKTPRVAYRFELKLHENKGEHQLELGPMTRRLQVSFQTADDEQVIRDSRATVHALVLGDINVLSGDANGRISIGNFKYDRSKQVVVRLGAHNPELGLEVESTNDPKVKAELRPPQIVGGQKEWELVVTIEPRYLLGELQPGANDDSRPSTLVTLQIKGPNPRRLRIPIDGKAER